MIRCPGCGHDNSDDAQFCERCGTDIPVVCPACKRQNNPGARFCRHCRSQIGDPAEVTVSAELSTAPSEALPAFFREGRYMVKEFLGEGARKKVYLCHDTLLDRDVAFALIKTEGLDETGRQRILREAQTMGRLGEHPNNVQLFDLGDERGQPYMVMPVMSGGDVQGLIQQAPDRRLPLEQAIAIAENVCLGLEFAHSQGVVHRDLKPGNVWLTSDGTARIGDFGLAVSMDRSRLTSEGMMVGTAFYMPPEQATGGQVTSAATCTHWGRCCTRW